MSSVEAIYRKSDDDNYNPFEHRQVAKPTSTIGSLIHIIKGSFGVGIMTIPNAFKHGGLLFSAIGTVVICMIYAHCVHLLASTSQKACRRSRIPLLGFAETAQNVFANGPPRVRPFATIAMRFVNLMILLQSFLAFCLFLIFVARSLGDVLSNQMQLDWETEIYILLVLIPTVVLTQIREIKYLVPFSAIANALLIVAIGITLYFIFSEPISLSERNLWPRWSTLPSFARLTAVLFAIQGIRYILPIEHKMQHPEQFLGKCGVINVAVGSLAILYVLTGFFGYAQYGEATQVSVTLNVPTDNLLSESARVLSAIAVLFTLGLGFYVPMEILWQAIQTKVPPKYHNWTQIGMRFTIVMILGAATIGLPEIEPFVGLVGSLTSGPLVVLYPVTIDVIFRWPTSDFGVLKWRLVKNALLYVFGLFVTIVGTYASIRNLVAVYQ